MVNNKCMTQVNLFKGHSDFTDMEAVTAFLQFVPMEDEILDFFKPVASQILSKLKARPCIPTQPNSQGKIYDFVFIEFCINPFHSDGLYYS